MSRTRKGNKEIGAEFWGKRPYSGEWPPAVYKRFTARKERAQEQQKLHRKKQRAIEFEASEKPKAQE